MRSQKGQALVEFALVIPFFLIVVIGVAEIAIQWHRNLALSAATRAAARTASTCRFQPSQTATTNAINASFDGTADTSLPGHSEPTYEFGSPPATQECDSTASNEVDPGTKITVRASYPVSINFFGTGFSLGTLTSTSVSSVE
jgi:Flp pilus assembly protein TadG